MLNIGVPTRRSPLVRPHVEQLSIPMPVQPRESVTALLHGRLVELRHRGYVVCRCGRDHLVDGHLLSGRALHVLWVSWQERGR